MRVREEHGIVLVSGGCSCGCRFCTRSEGRMGSTVQELKASPGLIPACHVATIMAGDLVNQSIVPVVSALTAAGTTEIYLYVHPACADVTPLKTLCEAGVTGIRLVLPAADRRTLALLCGRGASLENVSLLIRAANSLNMTVMLEVPVTDLNFEQVPDTVRRAAGMIARPAGICLEFVATHDATFIRKWDFRLATGAVDQVRVFASQHDIPLVLGGSAGVAPCAINPDEAEPGWYPELDTAGMGACATEHRPMEICGECPVSTSCVASMAGFWADRDRLDPMTAPDAGLARNVDPAAPVTAAELFIRRTDLQSMLLTASKIERCTAPWDSLEAHDRTGRTAPCEGSWPRREILGGPGGVDGEDGRGWLDKGLLATFNSPSMVRMRRAMVAGGRELACGSHCPRYQESWTDRPPTRLPRTRVFHENLLRNLGEFIDGAEVLTSRPLNITVSPSLKCNQHCRMCDINDPAAGDVDVRTPPAIFDEIRALLPTTATLALTGGEPLFSREIIDIVSGITPDRLPDTRVTLTTNGTLLSPDVIQAFRNSNIAAVYISLNSATAPTHAAITGVPGTFGRVLTNAAAMIDAARHMPLRPRVNLSFVVMRSTIDELGAFIELARGMGAGVRLLPIERNRDGESVFTDIETLERTESVIRTLRDRYLGQWPDAGDELARLHGVIHARLAAGDLSTI